MSSSTIRANASKLYSWWPRAMSRGPGKSIPFLMRSRRWWCFGLWFLRSVLKIKRCVFKHVRSQYDAHKLQGTRASLYNPAVLALLMIVGTFNRVTFPAYVLLPGLQAVPALWERNSHLIVFGLSAITTGLLAVLADTEFYSSTHPSFFDAIKRPIITPFNNVIYNLNPDNLKQHGIHPFYQHFVVNLPQFLGPTLPFVFNYIYGKRRSLTDISIPVRAALCGTLVLSFFSHQEARFLLPTVPLLLSAVNLPTGKRLYQGFIAAWFIFNLILGLLMGGYHQAGVYPAQIWLGEQGDQTVPTNANVFWWKTYSPPTWLLNGRSSELNTIDLMGLPKDQLQDRICDRQFEGPRLLVAPSSATFLDQFSVTKSFWKTSNRMGLDRMLWSTRSHLNLDDMDFGDDGIMPTLQRVIGKRGLAIWSVKC